jgi:hypothetical protein
MTETYKYFAKNNGFLSKNPSAEITYNYGSKEPAVKFDIYKSGNVKGKNMTINTGEQLPFCNDEISIDPPNEFVTSLNQNLAYQKNWNGEIIKEKPVTKIKPVVVPPAYDLESWKDNNLITYSAINSEGVQQDMYLSGYAESTCCGYIENGTELIPHTNKKINTYIGGSYPKENYQHDNTRENFIQAPKPVDDVTFIPRIPVRENFIQAPKPVDDVTFIPRIPVRENYCLETSENNKIRQIQKNKSGWVNTTCGYNPDQLNVNLPTNYPAGNCEQDPAFSDYNKNLFTQIVTPGVYSFNQVNEPINSNIGISYTQQIEPTSMRRDDQRLHYTLHDPRVIEPVKEIPDTEIKVTYDNVYDPRFYGYGTSYRSYSEPVTGQTRFMYDDVNAIRMPNYITRSKIDHLSYADKYGPMQENQEFGNDHNSIIRYLAQDSWLRDSIQYREDLQQSLMRKTNAEGWQKRMYPNSSRPVGSNYIMRG